MLVDDSLFATLDPTTRKTTTTDGRVFTLTDTVGFVRHLPHQLVESFRSTLEEIADADLVVHVIDGSDAHPEDQVVAVREVLTEIDAAQVPEIMVVNKIDAADEITLGRLRHLLPSAIFVSAATGEGIAHLREVIAQGLPDPAMRIEVLVPFTHGGLVSRVHAEGTVLSDGAHRRRHLDPGQGLSAGAGRSPSGLTIGSQSLPRGGAVATRRARPSRCLLREVSACGPAVSARGRGWTRGGGAVSWKSEKWCQRPVGLWVGGESVLTSR